MALKRCRRCGLPLRLSRQYIWPGNGTVFSRSDPGMRMAFCDADYYSYLWSELESRLGVSMAEAIIRGQRVAMQDFLRGNIIYGWRGSALRVLPLSLLKDRVPKVMALFGYGRMEIVEYRKRKSLVMRLQHPFDIITVSWGIKGFFEFLTDSASRMGWVKDGEDYVLTLTVAREERREKALNLEAQRAVREAKRELAKVEIGSAAGAGKWESCRACGLPSALAALEWIEDEGVIRQRESGRRFVFISGHVLSGMLREMKRERGEDLDRMLFEVTRDFYRRTLPGTPEVAKADFYRRMAEEISASGFGEVLDYAIGEGHLELTVANPFHHPRTAGRVAAMFEHVEGSEAEIEYRSTRPDRLEIELRTV